MAHLSYVSPCGLLSSRALYASSLALALFSAPVASATVIATDGNIPTVMDAGGSSGDFAEYIIGQSGAFIGQVNSNLTVGLNNSRNSLLIQNESHLRSTRELVLGKNNSSSGNLLIVRNSLVDGNGTIHIGNYGNDNSMLIEAGGRVQQGVLHVGEGQFIRNAQPEYESLNNSLKVTGLGSSLVLTTRLMVGNNGNRNRMDVVNGGVVNAGLSLVVGGGDSAGWTGHNNRLTVENRGSVLSVEGSAVVGGFGSHNITRIADEGIMLVDGSFNVGIGVDMNLSEGIITSANAGNGNGVSVSGNKTLLYIENNLLVGAYGDDNTFTVENQALVVVNESIYVSYTEQAEDNYLRINGGFLAWKGDRQSEAEALLQDGKILAWNIALQVWENALSSDQFFLHYFETDAEALAYTGYNELGGYTILSTGAIPEPGTYAAILSLVTVGLVLRVKRRRNSVLPA